MAPLEGEEKERFLKVARAAQRATGLTLAEVCIMAQRIASASLDPLYTIHGEVFELTLREDRKLDLHHWELTDVPEPFEPCDIWVALYRYELDCRHSYDWLANGATPEDEERIAENQLCWARFWAIRHPDSGARRLFAEYAAALESGEVVAWLTRLIEEQPNAVNRFPIYLKEWKSRW
jgi:hypothetical protein